MDFAHFADFARPENFAGHARRVVGVALVPHLSGDLVVFLGGLRQQARFPRRPRERLFDIDVLAGLHAGQRASGVHVIGRADDHGVDVLARFVEHLPKIFVLRGIRERSEPARPTRPIDIAQRDNVLDARMRRAQIAERLSAGTDRREVQLFIG